jgi:hypothetical protein
VEGPGRRERGIVLGLSRPQKSWRVQPEIGAVRAGVRGDDGSLRRMELPVLGEHEDGEWPRWWYPITLPTDWAHAISVSTDEPIIDLFEIDLRNSLFITHSGPLRRVARKLLSFTQGQG